MYTKGYSHVTNTFVIATLVGAKTKQFLLRVIYIVVYKGVSDVTFIFIK